MRKLLVITPLLLCGCSSFRSAVAAGTGAALASKFTRNPAIIGASAAGGALIGEGWNSRAKKSDQKAFDDGYRQGRGDATKQHYWNLQDKR